MRKRSIVNQVVDDQEQDDQNTVAAAKGMEVAEVAAPPVAEVAEPIETEASNNVCIKKMSQTSAPSPVTKSRINHQSINHSLFITPLSLRTISNCWIK